MTLSTLTEVMQATRKSKGYLVGFVVQGWEDAKAFVEAASETNSNIVLQAGPTFRDNMPLEAIGKMFQILASNTSVKIVAHLDHANDIAICTEALDHGFTSVMFDGSRLSLNKNMEQTLKVCDIAEKYKASVEAELGFVGYDRIHQNNFTCPKEVQMFSESIPIDALAISVGNTHLQRSHLARIDYGLLAEIRDASKVPLVIHGGSGISPIDRKKMAREFNVSKFNIGTELRILFGQSLRNFLKENSEVFDRFEIMKVVAKSLKDKAKLLLESSK
jgi:fructose-bisphosphate aldolase class II